MVDLFDRFKRAMDFMSCDVSTEVEVKTKNVSSSDVAVGMKFVDSKVVYNVTDIKTKDGIVCVYATTKSNKADGWFTRDSYNVIVD